MSEHSEKFIDYLIKLSENDKAALAIMKRSLGTEPGYYYPAYIYVAKFGNNTSPSYEKALHLIAGLFSMHPYHDKTSSFASTFGSFAYESKSKSIESRFISLLKASPENIHEYLRYAISLLNQKKIAFNFVELINDINLWFQIKDQEKRHHLKQKWARDFYCAYEPQLKDNQENTKILE